MPSVRIASPRCLVLGYIRTRMHEAVYATNSVRYTRTWLGRCTSVWIVTLNDTHIRRQRSANQYRILVCKIYLHCLCTRSGHSAHTFVCMWDWISRRCLRRIGTYKHICFDRFRISVTGKRVTILWLLLLFSKNRVPVTFSIHIVIVCVRCFVIECQPTKKKTSTSIQFGIHWMPNNWLILSYS